MIQIRMHFQLTTGYREITVARSTEEQARAYIGSVEELLGDESAVLAFHGESSATLIAVRKVVAVDFALLVP